MSDSTYNKATKFFLSAAAVIIFLYIFYLLSEIIIVLALAILLAFIFAPFVSILEAKGFNRLDFYIINFWNFWIRHILQFVYHNSEICFSDGPANKFIGRIFICRRAEDT